MVSNGSDVLQLESTVPYNLEDRISEAYKRKGRKSKYWYLFGDLGNIVVNSTLIILEVGSLHYLNSSMITKSRLRALLDEAGTIAITISYQVFLDKRRNFLAKSYRIILARRNL